MSHSYQRKIGSYALMAIFLLSPGLILAQAKTAVQLFFTSDVYGYLKPCG